MTYDMVPRDQLRKAAINCNRVAGTLLKLVDNPRLLDNRTYLLGTLRSLAHSMDTGSNPRMRVLQLSDDEERDIATTKNPR